MSTPPGALTVLVEQLGELAALFLCESFPQFGGEPVEVQTGGSPGERRQQVNRRSAGFFACVILAGVE